MARPRFAGRRMVKQWRGYSQSITTFTTGSTSLLAFLNIGDATTILRFLMDYAIGPSDAAPTAADHAVISLGLGIVSADAAAVGGTAMPESGTEAEYSWLWRVSHNVVFNTADIDFSNVLSQVRRSVDIRFMRKVKLGESLALIAQYEDGNGAPPVDLATGRSRVLVAIH